jgi:hypothetical protein
VIAACERGAAIDAAMPAMMAGRFVNILKLFLAVRGRRETGE